MKLPEEYKNWIEFAKRCNELLQKEPEAKTIKLYPLIKTNHIEEFVINDVKAAAFNEITEILSIDDVRSIYDAIHFRGIDSENIHRIMDLFITLAEKTNLGTNSNGEIC